MADLTKEDNDLVADEVYQVFIGLVTKIASVLEAADTDIEDLIHSGLDETFIERSIRDVKAAAYDKFDQAIIGLA